MRAPRVIPYVWNSRELNPEPGVVIHSRGRAFIAVADLYATADALVDAAEQLERQKI